MLSLSFSQSTTKKSFKATRNSLEASFRLFGSYLALILRFVGYVLSSFQRFSIDNSMIKKLYTADDSDDGGDEDSNKDKKVQDKEIKDENDEPALLKAGEAGKDRTEELCEEVSNRRVFSYSTSRWYFMHRMSSPICCCCRPRNKRNDILFKDAKQKLYEEIDLLEIVKKLRVNQFASDIVLKPR